MTEKLKPYTLLERLSRLAHRATNRILGCIDRLHGTTALWVVMIVTCLLACFVLALNAGMIVSNSRIVVNVVPATSQAYSYSYWYTHEYSQLSPIGSITGVKLIASCDIVRRDNAVVCDETGVAPSIVQSNLFADYTSWYACKAHNDRLACEEYSNQ